MIDNDPVDRQRKVVLSDHNYAIGRIGSCWTILRMLILTAVPVCCCFCILMHPSSRQSNNSISMEVHFIMYYVQFKGKYEAKKT